MSDEAKTTERDAKIVALDISVLIRALPYETLHKMLGSNRVSKSTHRKILQEWNYRDWLNEPEPLESIYK